MVEAAKLCLAYFRVLIAIMKMNPVHFTNQYDLPKDLYL